MKQLQRNKLTNEKSKRRMLHVPHLVVFAVFYCASQNNILLVGFQFYLSTAIKVETSQIQVHISKTYNKKTLQIAL